MPLYASGQVIGLQDEIKEALWAYSMGIHEQMWDFEAKTTLHGVVEELLGKNPDLFKDNPLGEKFFLTFRIPNPDVEKNGTKTMLEILDGIPSSYDKAQAFYKKILPGKKIIMPPVFEVILPMCTSVEQLNMVYYYYKNLVAGKGNSEIFPGSKTVSQWLGEFLPKTINVIPLFEDMQSQLNCAKIVRTFLKGKNLDRQRVFLARSDPFLNYGVPAAVLLINIALQDLFNLQEELSTPIYSIIGAGDGARGNFRPEKAESMVKGYPSCQTFTIQSAFKYDWPQDIVAEAIKKINSTKRREPLPVNKEKSIYLIKKLSAAYREKIPEIASFVNPFTSHIPSRRLRKLHIGLFGYSRKSGKVHLPRAIQYCACLYSIGLPPGMLGWNTVNSKDLVALKEEYPSPNLEEDLRDTLTYFNPESLSLFSSKLRGQIKKVLKITDFATNTDHKKITSEIIRCHKKQQTDPIHDLVIEAGRIRKFLG
jgi:phosphoenolpyruvate carboxylase